MSDVDPAFEAALDEAVESIPEDLFARLNNVIIDFFEEPTPEQLKIACGAELMGLYTGTPLPQRASSYGFANMPDRIWIFTGPIMRVAAGNHEAAVQRIREVVLHEIGHYFGLDDERLHELGY